MSKPITGGCHCGAVRYAVAAEPLMGGHCYCTTCQKLSGAGHASHLAFPEAAVAVTGPVATYACPADSGATVTSGFCRTCGSPVWGRSTGMPGMLTLRAASLDEPERFVPQLAVFTRSARRWDPPPAGLPGFAAMPPM